MLDLLISLVLAPMRLLIVWQNLRIAKKFFRWTQKVKALPAKKEIVAEMDIDVMAWMMTRKFDRKTESTYQIAKTYIVNYLLEAGYEQRHERVESSLISESFLKQPTVADKKRNPADVLPLKK